MAVKDKGRVPEGWAYYQFGGPMAALFADLSDAAPDESWEIVPEVFNLEDQLARARAAGG